MGTTGSSQCLERIFCAEFHHLPLLGVMVLNGERLLPFRGGLGGWLIIWTWHSLQQTMPNFDMWWLLMIVFEPKLPTSGGSPSPNSHMWVTGKPIVVEESAWPQMGILMFCQADRHLGFVHCIRFSTDPSYAENQDVMLGKEVNHPLIIPKITIFM